nr:hypothetical protein [Tanacetum cinerariifolium]
MKVIKEGFEKLRLYKINDDSFTYNTPLGTIFEGFNRFSRMDDDLFTYEVEIPKLAIILCDLKEEDDRMMTMDRYTKNALWIYWTRGDDELELTDEEFSAPDDENLIDKEEVAEIFRIEASIFDFETPICNAFDEFNYLLKIDIDLLTSDILRFKTYDEFKNEWIDEWNNGILIDDIHPICEPFRFKNGKAK